MSNNCLISKLDNKSILYILITLSINSKGLNKMRTKVKTIIVQSTSKAHKKAQLKRHKAKVRTQGKKIARDYR